MLKFTEKELNYAEELLHKMLVKIESKSMKSTSNL